MNCRPGCGACCIAPSISSLQKPAGQVCMYLTHDYRCSIFGSVQRPACCAGLQPSREMCGSDRDAALAWLEALERDTSSLSDLSSADGPISRSGTNLRVSG